MRKLLLTSKVLLSISILFSFILNLFSAWYGDIEYEINDSFVKILSYKDSNSTLLIPATIVGKPVKIIEKDAFAGCSSLRSVTIPFSVEIIGDGAFASCNKITSITLGNGVKQIGYRAFYSCGNLTTVTIPDNVETIGEEAFNDCYYLTTITIGSGVKQIGREAFSWCWNLTNIIVASDNQYFCSDNGILFNKAKTVIFRYPPNKPETNYIIPDSVETISDGAFEGCKNLLSITIGSGVKQVGRKVFSWCWHLTNIAVKSDNKYFCSVDGVLFDKAMTVIIRYPQNKPETSYIIPDSVEIISDWAFAWSDKLTSITIGNGVKQIGKEAFSYCKSLQKVYFQGIAPDAELDVFDSTPATIYYLPGTYGWDTTYCGKPTALWTPSISTNNAFIQRF